MQARNWETGLGIIQDNWGFQSRKQYPNCRVFHFWISNSNIEPPTAGTSFPFVDLNPQLPGLILQLWDNKWSYTRLDLKPKTAVLH